MKQFGKILSFELKYYLKNKIFVGITLFLVLLIAAVMSYPRVSALFAEKPSEDGSIVSSEAGSEADRLPIMLLKVDEAQAEAVREAFAAAFTDYDVQLSKDEAEAVKAAIAEGEADCAFVLSSPTEYTYYVNNLGMYDSNMMVADELLRQLYQLNAMVQSGMSAEQAAEIMNTGISGKAESLGKDQAENFLYTYIMIFALYMVILLYGQMVATNVATEKSSRAMEVLITSAKPTAMMFGKVLASCLAGLFQLIAVFGSAVIFYALNKSYFSGMVMVESLFSIPPELLVYMLLFFVLGFFIYAFLFGAIGSTASKVEDINISTMPLMFMFIIAFMVVMFSMSSGDVDNMLIKVCSYIPFTSPMAMFTRIAMSTVVWYEILISVVILAGSVVGIGVLSAKIYRVGVLMYGASPKLGKLIKAVWNA